MGLLVSQASTEKINWLWIMSYFWGLFFHVFMGKNLIFKIKFLTMRTWKNNSKKLLRIHNQFFFSVLAWLPKRPILGRNRNLKGSPCLLSIYSLQHTLITYCPVWWQLTLGRLLGPNWILWYLILHWSNKNAKWFDILSYLFRYHKSLVKCANCVCDIALQVREKKYV